MAGVPSGLATRNAKRRVSMEKLVNDGVETDYDETGQSSEKVRAGDSRTGNSRKEKPDACSRFNVRFKTRSKAKKHLVKDKRSRAPTIHQPPARSISLP
jgi:hypothetical protein